jgi:FAD/FMN-containing dehydrogenase
LDVCVPRSRLAEALREINSIAARHQLPVAYLAHAGDGNLHPGFLCDLSREDDRRRVHQTSEEVLQYCAAIGGSIGGEHGIGIEKRAAMAAMYLPAELAAMQQVKQVFDPQDRLNPGKLFPAELAPFEPCTAPDGPLPESPFEPLSPQEVADGLCAMQSGQRVVRLSGRGQQWQGRVDPGVQCSTRKLHGILALSAEDFYVTALAGTSFQALQAALYERGFWLAAASPWPQGTLGGLLATNLNSPLRTLFGGLRDQLLAVQVALADGRLLRFGRPLAKDVAGFQMAKLFCGSFGSLGALTEVTLKIVSQPLARRTFVLRLAEIPPALQAGLAVLRMTTLCSGVVMVPGEAADATASGCSIIITLEGHPADVTAELHLLQEMLSRSCESCFEESDPATASQVWAERLSGWNFSARAAVPPGQLSGLLACLGAASLGQDWILDIANGVLWCGENSGEIGRAARRLLEVRQAAKAHAGYAVMTAGPRPWLGQIAAWGALRPSHSLMRRLKLRWDAGDILNRGEFI